MQNIRMGLIGYGLSGSVFHAPLITAVPGLTLAKVVSAKPEKVRSDYPEVEVVSEVEALVADPEIDVVVISSPNYTHYPYAKLALQANKHVIIEKPFANSVKEAEELIALAAEKKLLVSVFQNRCWDNDFLTVQKCIQEGLLGDIYTFEAHYDLFRPQVGSKWKEHAGEGCGALFDLGPHIIDQALHLFGMPNSISAELLNQRPGADVDDYFHLVLAYDRLRVILHSGSVVKSPGPHFQVHGSKGSLLKYGMDPQQGDLQRGLRPGHPEWGKDQEKWHASLTLGKELNITATVETVRGCYEAYYQGIYQAVANGGPLPVSSEDGKAIMQIIEAALQSHNEGRRVVVGKDKEAF